MRHLRTLVSQPQRFSNGVSPVAVHLLVIALILARDDAGQPFFTAQVPVDGPGDALLERDRGLPAQLTDDLAGINGIPAIVPRPVLHVPNQALRLAQADRIRWTISRFVFSLQPPTL